MLKTLPKKIEAALETARKTAEGKSAQADNSGIRDSCHNLDTGDGV
jgi:hypothetical protein